MRWIGLLKLGLAGMGLIAVVGCTSNYSPSTPATGSGTEKSAVTDGEPPIAELSPTLEAKLEDHPAIREIVDVELACSGGLDRLLLRSDGTLEFYHNRVGKADGTWSPTSEKNHYSRQIPPQYTDSPIAREEVSWEPGASGGRVGSYQCRKTALAISQ